MRVSVVVPTKNRATILPRAVDSIKSQKDVDVEIIVVNDGSTDNTIELVKEKYPEAKLINNVRSVGGAKARNIGAENATGDFVAFLDSDDEWLPNHLISKIKIIDNTGANGAYGTFYLKDDISQKEIKFYDNFPASYSIGDKIASFKPHDTRTSTFVFKKSKFDDIKFDNNLKKHQDWDLAINFELGNKIICDFTPTVIIHVDSLHSRMSNNLNHEATSYFLKKNMKLLSDEGYYNFCIKMVMRCQALGEKKALNCYLDLIEGKYNSLTAMQKTIFMLTKYMGLNLNAIRELKNMLKFYQIKN